MNVITMKFLGINLLQPARLIGVLVVLIIIGAIFLKKKKLRGSINLKHSKKTEVDPTNNQTKQILQELESTKNRAIEFIRRRQYG